VFQEVTKECYDGPIEQGNILESRRVGGVEAHHGNLDISSRTRRISYFAQDRRDVAVAANLKSRAMAPKCRPILTVSSNPREGAALSFNEAEERSFCAGSFVT